MRGFLSSFIALIVVSAGPAALTQAMAADAYYVSPSEIDLIHILPPPPPPDTPEGKADLEAVHAQDICGADNVETLVGPSSARRPDVYADTSPAELGVGSDVERLISGDQDPIAPPALAGAYTAKMRGRGAHINALTVPNTGHVELISPGTVAWARTVRTIQALLRRQPDARQPTDPGRR